MSPGTNARPLAGIRVVVTRAREQAGELTCLLEQQGASVIALPAVEFAAAENSDTLDKAIREIGRFDWIVFTSQNAVRFFVARCGESETPPANWQCRIAAVGVATAEYASSSGFRVDFVATRYGSGRLGHEIRSEVAFKKVLLPRSDRASAELPDALRHAGAYVTEVIGYRTLLPPGLNASLDAVRRGEVDVIAFASPSAVRNFFESLGPEPQIDHVVLAAIGPTTEAAIIDSGHAAQVIPSESTAGNLAAAITEHFRNRVART